MCRADFLFMLAHMYSAVTEQDVPQGELQDDRSVVQHEPGEVCQSLLLPEPEDCPAASTPAKAGLPMQTSKVRRSCKAGPSNVKYIDLLEGKGQQEHGLCCSAQVDQQSCPTDLLAVLCT